ncbi:MAG: purine-nucleoside phosphorylase [Vulcanimicrobiaceae bacterium]
MKKSIKRIREMAGGTIEVAIVLGSGLSKAIDSKLKLVRMPFSKFEEMPFAALKGHAAEVLAGEWHGKRIAVFAGRVHLYQGFSPQDVTYNVRLAHACGARNLIVTNAAGGLNPAFTPGELMLLIDHLNLTGANPLTAQKSKNPFIDMGDAYAPHLRQLAKQAAQRTAPIREGVYAGVLGPTYETPAEARYLRILGADAVGMSTVLETIQARALGMFVLGFSAVTNTVGSAETSHAEVTAMAARSGARLAEILDGVIASI